VAALELRKTEPDTNGHRAVWSKANRGTSPLRVPAQAYLVWAFERLGTHREAFDLPLEALTPAAFKKTLG
jgi:hypothetical protein